MLGFSGRRPPDAQPTISAIGANRNKVLIMRFSMRWSPMSDVYRKFTTHSLPGCLAAHCLIRVTAERELPVGLHFLNRSIVYVFD